MNAENTVDEIDDVNNVINKNNLTNLRQLDISAVTNELDETNQNLIEDIYKESTIFNKNDEFKTDDLPSRTKSVNIKNPR